MRCAGVPRPAAGPPRNASAWRADASQRVSQDQSARLSPSSFARKDGNESCTRRRHLKSPGQSFSRTPEAGIQPSGLALEFRAGSEAYRLALGLDESDSIAGTSARDHGWGLGGADAIGGGAGQDVLSGGAGRDLLSGNDGMDLLRGGNGADTFYGGAEADMLFGGAGNDYLDEGAGHSGLEGGPGDDTLVGGQGPDAFVVDRTSGEDTILDFTAGPGTFDHIALRELRWENLTVEDTTSGARISWDGGSVLLVGVAKAELAQDDFMFAGSPDLPPASRNPVGPAAERGSPSDPGPEITGADDSLPVRPRMDGFALPVDGGKAVVGGNAGDDLAGGTCSTSVRVTACLRAGAGTTP